MGLFSGIFGGGVSGASRQSSEQQRLQNERTQSFIEEQAGLARQDALRLFPSADLARTQGFQGALDVIGQGIDPRLSAFTQGNIGAQEITAATLPQIQNALLGLPVDQSAFVPRDLNTDTSFLQNVALPEQVAPPEVNEVAPQVNVGNLLASIGAGDGRLRGSANLLSGIFNRNR